jgi:hypothetical protein
MPIRNPIYLDQELLSNLADYFGIRTFTTQIVETDTSKLGGSLNLKVLDVGLSGEKGGSQETQATYELRVTPVRLMNDVIDFAQREGHVDVLKSGIAKGSTLELDGIPTMTVVSEIGPLLGKFVPMIMASNGQIVASDFAALLSEDTPSSPLLFDLEVEDGDVSVYFSVDPASFFGANAPDDLSGDLTIFGTVERLVPEGKQVPIDQWLFPGVNRVMRKAIAAKGTADLVKQFAPMLGDSVDLSYQLDGPAIVVRPLAIY